MHTRVRGRRHLLVRQVSERGRRWSEEAEGAVRMLGRPRVAHRARLPCVRPSPLTQRRPLRVPGRPGRVRPRSRHVRQHGDQQRALRGLQRRLLRDAHLRARQVRVERSAGAALLAPAAACRSTAPALFPLDTRSLIAHRFSRQPRAASLCIYMILSSSATTLLPGRLSPLIPSRQFNPPLLTSVHFPLLSVTLCPFRPILPCPLLPLLLALAHQTSVA